MTICPSTDPVLVRDDNTTTCCNAYSSISIDDGVEYCKCCYRPIDGYVSRDREGRTVTIPL